MDNSFIIPGGFSLENKAPVNSAPSLEAAIVRLVERLKSEPDDISGWILLGRSYQHINQHEKAREAYMKAVEAGSSEQSVVDALFQLDQVLGNSEIKKEFNEAQKTISNQKEDAIYWVKLGKIYQKERQFTQAAQSYEKASVLKPDDPDIKADLADVLAASNGNQITGRSMQLIESALAINPSHIKALWLAGTGAMQQGNETAAIGYWQKLLKLIPAQSDDARIIEMNIAELQKGTASRELWK